MRLFIDKAHAETDKHGRKIYHHGQVWGTKDLKGDKALVKPYKSKDGKMKDPPKGKKAKRDMASDMIREHMHHLGRHPGGPKQAIAIGLRQAGMAKKSMGDPEVAHHVRMAEHHQNVVRQCISTGGQTGLSMRSLKALAAHLRAIRTAGTHSFDEDSARAKKLSADIEANPISKAGISKEFLEDLTDEERKLFHQMRHEELAKRAASRGERDSSRGAPQAASSKPEEPKHEPLFPKAPEREGKLTPIQYRVVKPEDPPAPSEAPAKPVQGPKQGEPKAPHPSVLANYRPNVRPSQMGTFGNQLWSALKNPKKTKDMDKATPEGAPKPAFTKVAMHPGLHEAHQKASEAMNHLLRLQEHLSGMADRWKAEDDQISSERAKLLRRSLEDLMSKARIEFTKQARKSIDEIAERERAQTRAARKSATSEATQILKATLEKARMKLVTDSTGKMSPVATEHTPTMSLERTEGGQHRMVGPSSFSGGGSTRDKDGPDVIASSPRMHTPGVGQPGGVKVSDPKKPQYTPGQLHVAASGGTGSMPKGSSVLASAPPPKPAGTPSVPKIGAPAAPKTETQSALAELKQMGPKEKALKALLDKAISGITTNPHHGEPALHHRTSSPVEHHSLAAAFHERRAEGALPGTDAQEHHNTLAGFHRKQLTAKVGAKQASAAIKQAHTTLTDQGTSAIKDRHTSPGNKPSFHIGASEISHEPAFAKQSASGIRGKLMASVSGQMDKALEALLQKSGPAACPECGNRLSKPSVKTCPHCKAHVRAIGGPAKKKIQKAHGKVEKSTPYQDHEKLGHKTSFHSPNGYDKIEECRECGKRWLHHPGDKYPSSMSISKQWAEEHSKKSGKVEKAHDFYPGQAVHVEGEKVAGNIKEIHSGKVFVRHAGGAVRAHDASKLSPVRGPIHDTTPGAGGIAGPIKHEKVEKAMSAAAVPRMPRAIAASMDSWRNATNVMTRTNSRFSDGYPTAALTPDPTEVVPEQVMKSNPTVCKGCGRSFMDKGGGCPTCVTRKSTNGPKW